MRRPRTGRTVALVLTDRVVGLDLATGRLGAGQDLPGTADRQTQRGQVLGLAFTDNRTVRVAGYVLPIDSRDDHDLGTVLKVAAFPV